MAFSCLVKALLEGEKDTPALSGLLKLYYSTCTATSLIMDLLSNYPSQSIICSITVSKNTNTRMSFIVSSHN